MRLRSLVLGLVAMPYFSLIIADSWLHVKSRRISHWEQIAHALAAICLFALAIAVLSQHPQAVTFSFFSFVIVSMLDEILFHRGISKIERAIHISSWIALAFFMAVWRST